MIGRLTGRIESTSLNSLIVDVQGVGYQVDVPAGLPGRLDLDEDGRGTIHIYTSVRDDAIDLYGFATPTQKELFERLTGVSGIGPKTALGVLTELAPSEVVKAVRANRMEAFKQVKGIGEKTAQRLMLELKNKVDDLDFDEITPPEELDADDEMVENLRSALSNFGYDNSEIEQVIGSMDESTFDEASSVEPLVRNALDLLR
jgi:Holliday junction DNA helicase RuvA